MVTSLGMATDSLTVRTDRALSLIEASIAPPVAAARGLHAVA
jgi:hypothetical protein